MINSFPEPNCAHIVKSDDAFKKRMRFHQSWFRRHHLIKEPGPNPYARGELYGNMLCEQDGLAGKNFFNDAIHKYAETRLAKNPKHIQASRLRNNLLSSQPMCFNLFSPLIIDRVMAKSLVDSMLGFGHVTNISDVIIEYAPKKEELLDDESSFDCWIEYERDNSTKGFLGIETKLTEPFSQDSYPFDERYQRWQSKKDWWWVPDAEKQFPDKLVNQMWRNHLLAFALQNREDSKYAESFTIVIYHAQDKQVDNVFKNYSGLLAPNGKKTLITLTLDELLHRWEGQVFDTKWRDWLDYLKLRYLNLEASEPDWRRFRGG